MAKRSSSAEDSRVQGLERGIEVLRALNASTGGRNSVARLSAETGLHRTTVKRLLETLKHLGIVRYLDDSNEYCLALNVLQLSEGFRDVVLDSGSCAAFDARLDTQGAVAERPDDPRHG